MYSAIALLGFVAPALALKYADIFGPEWEKGFTVPVGRSLQTHILSAFASSGEKRLVSATAEPTPCYNRTTIDRFQYFDDKPENYTLGAYGLNEVAMQAVHCGIPLTVHHPEPSKSYMKFSGVIRFDPVGPFYSFEIPSLTIYPVKPETPPRNLLVTFYPYDMGNMMTIRVPVESWGKIDLGAAIKKEKLEWYEGLDYGLGELWLGVDGWETFEEFYIVEWVQTNRCDALRYTDVLPCAGDCPSRRPWYNPMSN